MAEKRVTGDLAGNLAMVLLRYHKGLDQGELARLAHIAASQVSEYDRGERPIPGPTLGRVADAVDFPDFLLDPLVREIRAFLVSSAGWSRAKGALTGEVFAELLELCGSAVEVILGLATAEEPRPPAVEVRDQADELWARLKGFTHTERLAVVEELEEYQSRAIAERVAAASREEAVSRPDEAVKLGLLAERIAELADGAQQEASCRL